MLPCVYLVFIFRANVPLANTDAVLFPLITEFTLTRWDAVQQCYKRIPDYGDAQHEEYLQPYTSQSFAEFVLIIMNSCNTAEIILQKHWIQQS
jgi:hypothetical protein